MQHGVPRITAITAVALLGLSPTAVAHSHYEDATINMSQPNLTLTSSNVSATDIYFRNAEYSTLMMAHIVLMTIGWVFILPIGVMLSIARSHYTLLVQFAFLMVNTTGVLLAASYNARMPDLYPGNAHHKFGWILTWAFGAQLAMRIIHIYSGRISQGKTEYTRISCEAMAEHQRIQLSRHDEPHRCSNDSGHGTERNTESLRSNSLASTDSLGNLLNPIEHEDVEEARGVMYTSIVDRIFAKTSVMVSAGVLRALSLLCNAVDRTILVLGFIALSSGIVTYGGFFMGQSVYSGLAHFIKGGVFFWYGILTLGRWAGCFVDIGWAWNVNPSSRGRPSAEFVESFLIFFYGATNVFLEHLAAWGKPWSAQDLEHISLTLLFLGGGLCGMIVESKSVRDLLGTVKQSQFTHHTEKCKAEEEPESYRTPMNPIPALVVFLLGKMMSSHHQESMVSTMIHAQWGALLMGSALARLATYMLTFLSPPTSVLPGRPPTELLTGFCLMAGGIIFMTSARDTVTAIENNGLDAIFVFTVAMGIITFLMAWVILVIAINGWAVRKENMIFACRSVV